jgi:hypothetical protein
MTANGSGVCEVAFLKAKILKMIDKKTFRNLAIAEGLLTGIIDAMEYQKYNPIPEEKIIDAAQKAISHIQKARLLLKTDTGASTESAHFANTMLGECAANDQSSNNEQLAGALGATRSVRQNEQTREVCNVIKCHCNTEDERHDCYAPCDYKG